MILNSVNIRYFVLSSALLMLPAVCSANADGLPVGQFDTDLPKVSPYGTEVAGTLKAAMLIDPSSIETASNLELVNIRFGLTSKISISEVSVWAAYSLDEKPFMEYTLTQPIVKGWNDVDLPEGVACENRPYYIGYTLKTEGPSFPIAIIQDGYKTGFVYDGGNGWENHEKDNTGSLAICAKINGEGIPQYDLGIVNVETPRIINSRTSNNVQIEVLNAGSRKISGFTITCTENNDNTLVQKWDIPTEIESNRRDKIQLDFLPLSPQGSSNVPFSFTVSEIKDGQDFNPENNSFDVKASVSSYSFNKRLLVEEYTGETCGNCPNAAALLHDAIATNDYSDKVIVVCHHAGFKDDSFTLPCDLELIKLFGSSSTYNPAMSFDRLSINNQAVISHVPGSIKEMTGIFDYCLNREAPVDMEITGEYDNHNGVLNVKVNGMSVDGKEPKDINALTVYLLEDNVKPNPIQLGADETYRHNHVIRAYNSTWGAAIPWTPEGQFTYEVSLKVPGGVDTENTSLVAFASKYNASKLSDCEIANSVSSKEIAWDGYSGIEIIDQTDDICSVIYYDITGRQVQVDTKGLIIKVETTAKGHKRSSKIMNQ